MNWLDVVLIIFLVCAAIWGMMRGLLLTLIPLIGLIVGLVVAGNYYADLAHNVFRSDSSGANIGAFILILIVILIVAAIIAQLLHRLLGVVLLGWIDHLAGFVFGAIIGGLVAGAIMIILLKYNIGVSTMSNSAIAAFFIDKFPVALAFLPSEFDRVKQFFQR